MVIPMEKQFQMALQMARLMATIRMSHPANKTEKQINKFILLYFVYFSSHPCVVPEKNNIYIYNLLQLQMTPITEQNI